MIPERRTRRTRPPEVVSPDTREALTTWMNQKFEEIERAHQERVELLRNGGEHPMPVFQRMVRNFGALGMPKRLIGKMLGLSVANLESFYGDEYDLGAAEVISSVAANMIRIATSTIDPNNAKVGMQILDRRGDEEWRPPAQKLEVSNKKNEAPLLDSSKLTYAERQTLRAMLTRIAEGGEGDPLQPEEEGPMIGE